MRKSTRFIQLGLIIVLMLLVLPTYVFADTEVATVDDTKYDTLQAAINAANGREVKLLKDVTEEIVISNNSSVTLALNGFNITNVSTDTIKVALGSTLLLKGNGIIDNITSKTAALYNNGTVTIDGPTLTKTKNIDFYAILNHGKMIINSCSIMFDSTAASLIDNGYYDFTSKDEKSGYIAGTNIEKPMLTINGGTFSGGMNTVKNDDNGELIINGGTFSNNYQVAVMNWNITTINGGTFNTPSGMDKTNLWNGTFGSDSVDKGILTVNKGTFNGDYVIEGNFNKASDIVFNGGKFNYKVAFANIMKTSGSGTQLSTLGADIKTYVSTSSTLITIDGIYQAGTPSDLSDIVNALDKKSTVIVVSGNLNVKNDNQDVAINNESTGNVSINGTETTTGTKSVKNEDTLVILSTDDKSVISGNLLIKSVKDETKNSLAVTAVNNNDSAVLGIYDISIVKDAKTVPVTDTDLTIRIFVGASNLAKYKSYKVVYLGTEKTENFDAVVEGDYLVFHTKHLSTYAVVGVEEVKTSNTAEIKNPKTFDGILNYVIVGFISLIGIISILHYLKKENN